jgi:hypothetical protein
MMLKCTYLPDNLYEKLLDPKPAALLHGSRPRHVVAVVPCTWQCYGSASLSCVSVSSCCIDGIRF